jgi:beta-lactam-binding protein with PASTA domain
VALRARRLALSQPAAPTLICTARIALAEHKLKVTVVSAPGKPGRVLSQKPAGGAAAAPGMTVQIKVGAAG